MVDLCSPLDATGSGFGSGSGSGFGPGFGSIRG